MPEDEEEIVLTSAVSETSASEKGEMASSRGT